MAGGFYVLLFAHVAVFRGPFFEDVHSYRRTLGRSVNRESTTHLRPRSALAYHIYL